MNDVEYEIEKISTVDVNGIVCSLLADEGNYFDAVCYTSKTHLDGYHCGGRAVPAWHQDPGWRAPVLGRLWGHNASMRQLRELTEPTAPRRIATRPPLNVERSTLLVPS